MGIFVAERGEGDEAVKVLAAKPLAQALLGAPPGKAWAALRRRAGLHVDEHLFKRPRNKKAEPAVTLADLRKIASRLSVEERERAEQVLQAAAAALGGELEELSARDSGGIFIAHLEATGDPVLAAKPLAGRILGAQSSKAWETLQRRAKLEVSEHQFDRQRSRGPEPALALAQAYALISYLTVEERSRAAHVLEEAVAALGGSAAALSAVKPVAASVFLSAEISILILAATAELPPRFVIFQFIKALDVLADSSTYFYKTIRPYLIACGVRLEAGGPPTEGAMDITLPGTEVSDAERRLARSSIGICSESVPAYDRGRPTLTGDLPIMLLILNVIRTPKARALSVEQMETAVLTMGLPEQQLKPFLDFFRQERASAPPDSLLRFFEQAAPAHAGLKVAEQVSAKSEEPTSSMGARDQADKEDSEDAEPPEEPATKRRRAREVLIDETADEATQDTEMTTRFDYIDKALADQNASQQQISLVVQGLSLSQDKICAAMERLIEAQRSGAEQQSFGASLNEVSAAVANLSTSLAKAQEQFAAGQQALLARLDALEQANGQREAAQQQAVANAASAAVHSTLQRTAEAYTVLEVTRGAGVARGEQEWLRQHGRNAGADLEAYQKDVPLDVTAFLEEKLQPRDHYVIAHAKPLFAKELKRLRLLRFQEAGAAFWIAYSLAAWRLAYVEADRDLMEAVWQSEAMQQHFQRQLQLHRPAMRRAALARRMTRHARTRPGPQRARRA